MKKLFLGSTALLLFSVSILIFEISCEKTATAGSNSQNTNQLGKLIFTASRGSYGEIWISDYNGQNNVRLNISLPSGFTIPEHSGAKISPDGNTIFFNAYNSLGKTSIFSCKLDGSNVQKIIDGANYGTSGSYLEGAY